MSFSLKNLVLAAALTVPGLNGAKADEPAVIKNTDTVESVTPLHDLVRQVQEGAREEAISAANILRDNWLDHEEYAVRYLVQEVLLEAPSDDREIIVDKSSAIQALQTIPPVGSVDEWLSHPNQKLFATAQKQYITGLDSNDHEERVEASRILFKDSQDLQSFVYPLPENANDFMSSSYKHPSLESRARVKAMNDQIKEQKILRSALPPLSMPANDLVEEMNKHFGCKITIDDALPVNTRIETKLDENSYSDMLAVLCNTLKAYPLAEHHPHEISLVPQGENKYFIHSYDIALIVSGQTEDGLYTEAELHPDPTYTFLDLQKFYNKPYNIYKLLIPPTFNPWAYWNIDISPPCTDKPVTYVSSDENNSVEQPTFGVEAWIASQPVTHKQDLHNGYGKYEDDVRTIVFETRQESDGVWKTEVFIDMDTYKLTRHSLGLTCAAADNIQFTFRGANGNELSLDRGDPYVDSAKDMNLIFYTDEPPDEVSIKAFDEITKEGFIFHANGSVVMQRLANSVSIGL